MGAFRDGLRRLGWLDGRNLRFEYRWDAGSPARVRTYAAELVGQAPHAILVAGTPPLAVGGAGFGIAGALTNLRAAGEERQKLSKASAQLEQEA